MNNLIIVGLAIVLFLCMIFGFRYGLRLGMRTSKGIEPEKIRTPAQVVSGIRDNHEAKKESKEFMSEYSEMMEYNGDLPKEKSDD